MHLRPAVATPCLAALVLAGAVLSACGSSSSSTSTTSTSTSTTTAPATTTTGPPTTVAVPANSNGLATKSASEIVAAALAATKAQKSMRVEEDTTEGTAKVALVDDVNATGGIQTIAISTGSTVGHVEIVFVDSVVYFRGDAAGLENFTQFGTAKSTKYANQWISVTSKQEGYSTLSAALTLDTAAAQFVSLPGTLSPGSPTKIGKVVVMGVNAVDSSKSAKLTLTEYVNLVGTALPVEVRGITAAASGAGRTVTVAFSKWNEPVNPTAPSSAVPITTLLAKG